MGMRGHRFYSWEAGTHDPRLQISLAAGEKRFQEAGGKAGRMALRRHGGGRSRGPWRMEEPGPGETAGSALRMRVCGTAAVPQTTSPSHMHREQKNTYFFKHV